MSKLTIRKIRRHELLDAVKLVMCSADDLRLKSGRKPWNATVTEVPAFGYHLYDTDPDGHWGAYIESKMVGFGSAIMRGRQWYLAFLFVDPRFQLKGIGRKLMERCLVYGENKVESHALCTYPYNETAVALYSSFGMMPISPIFEMHRKVEKGEKITASNLVMEQDKTKKTIQRINRLDKEIRGYPHLVDLEFFAADPKHQICNFYDGDDWAGYSIIAGGKLIAPAGAVDPRFLPDIINDSYKLCLESGADLCRLWIGGPNEITYKKAISLGFKISELAVFLSTVPYGDFSRYCPAHLAIF
jgi:ribosomal protein S18 acetylase RimI-like enzyme